MVDLTDEGISLLQARPHDPNELAPSPFGRVTAPVFWLVRHNLAAFRTTGFVVLAALTVALILLVITPRARERVAIAFTGGVAAAAVFYGEYLRTPNYNWVVGVGLGVVAIGLLVVIAPPARVAAWTSRRSDLLGGVIMGFGLAVTATARIHSAAAAVIVVALAWLARSLRLPRNDAALRNASRQALRVGIAAATTGACWVLLALVLPAGGVASLRRDVRNNIDWLDTAGSTSTRALRDYPGDLRDFLGAVAGKLGVQAPGAVLALVVVVVPVVALAVISNNHGRARASWPLGSGSTVAVVTTGAALVGASLSALAIGELQSGYASAEDLGPSLLALVVWTAAGRAVGVGIVTALARRGGAPAPRPNGPAQPGWILLTAALLGLAVAASVGSGNPMAYQLHYGSVPLIAALACTVGWWSEDRRLVGKHNRGLLVPRSAQGASLLVALVCVALGGFAMRTVLDARSDPYRELPLSTATASFRSRATGVSVDLPEGQGRALEQLEREARRAGWRPGTPLLDISPFHPFVTFWLGADPPFSVYPSVDSVHATDSLLLTVDREEDDDLRRAWLLVSSPLLGDVDYAAIARALGRPWPCGYEAVAHANLTPTLGPEQVTLLRPPPGPIPRVCRGTDASSG